MNRIRSASPLRYVICCTVLLAGNCLIENSVAQDWPIFNPPVEESVPQYNQSYPLTPNQAAPQNGQFGDAAEPGAIPNSPDFQGTNDFQSLSTNQSTPHSVKLRTEPLQSQHYGLDYSVHRDRNAFPVDPRKPCNTCTHPPQVRAKTKHNLPGLKGRPYQETEPGGCRCGNKSCPKCSMASVYWPRPLSAKWDHHHPDRAANRKMGCQKKRLVDAFDHLVDFRVSHYQRTDNGYCGPGSDPYGCLGESKQIPGVIVVGYRNPGSPAAIPAPFNQ